MRSTKHTAPAPLAGAEVMIDMDDVYGYFENERDRSSKKVSCCRVVSLMRIGVAPQRETQSQDEY